MFRLNERVAGIERKLKQATCEHIFGQISFQKADGGATWLDSKCSICDKTLRRCVSGKEIDVACALLKKEMLKG